MIIFNSLETIREIENRANRLELEYVFLMHKLIISFAVLFLFYNHTKLHTLFATS